MTTPATVTAKHSPIKAEAPSFRTHLRASAPGELNVRASGDVTEIDVFGVIGDWGLRAEDFKRTLDTVNTSSIIVNINSPGGDVFAGIAAYNALVEHQAAITVRIYGLAASAASLIAMAGDTIVMGEGAFLMIHNAWTVGIGDTREMAKMSKLLSQIDKELAGIYSERSGIARDDVKDMMDAETWLSAEDAIDQNFADETMRDVENKTGIFDLSAFRNVPKALIAPKKQKRARPEGGGHNPDLAALNSALRELHGKIAA